MTDAHLHTISIAVSDEYRVSIAAMQGRNRDARVVLPRQAFCYIARQMTDLSITNIGRFMGGRDHTTVIKAINNIQIKMQADDYLRCQIESLQSALEPTFTTRFYRHGAFNFTHSERLPA